MVVCKWWCDELHQSDEDPIVVRKAFSFLEALARDYAADKIRESNLKSERNLRLDRDGIRTVKKRPAGETASPSAAPTQPQPILACKRRKRENTNVTTSAEPPAVELGSLSNIDGEALSSDAEGDEGSPCQEQTGACDDGWDSDGASSLEKPTMWGQARLFACQRWRKLGGRCSKHTFE